MSRVGLPVGASGRVTPWGWAGEVAVDVPARAGGVVRRPARARGPWRSPCSLRIHGKGDQARRAPLHPPLRAALTGWLAERARLARQRRPRAVPQTSRAAVPWRHRGL